MKVVTNPDGTMQTVPSSEVDAQKKLQQTRRELKDMLSGNTPFHEDNLGKKEAIAPPVEEEKQINIYEYFGMGLEECLD